MNNEVAYAYPLESAEVGGLVITLDWPVPSECHGPIGVGRHYLCTICYRAFHGPEEAAEGHLWVLPAFTQPGGRHSVTWRSSPWISASNALISASISSNGLGGTYL